MRHRGDTAAHASVLLNMGALLVVTDREAEAVELLDEALAMAQRAGAADVVALCHNYRGSARLQLGDAGGEQELLRSVEAATASGQHEYVTRGFYNLVEGLWRLGRHEDAVAYSDRAVAYARDRDFQIQRYFFAARGYRLLALRGRWGEAEAGIRGLLDGQGDPGMPARETLPVLARILVRRGSPDAADVLALAAAHADRADNLEWLVPTAMAHIEHAWTTGRADHAQPWTTRLLERTDRPGMHLQRGELLCWMRRLGAPVPPFPDCAEPYAAGLRGDWQVAADGHTDPYERALELADSGAVSPTLEALELLEQLGAEPAAAIVRRRLRGLGVSRVPRPRPATTRANPAGLTDRQVEILRLVAADLSNAEIAQRLVLSVRTVDHHVSAVLQKLGVRTRREASTAASDLDLTS
jgi:DNA-binding CsgD family transcriptional regulator